MELERRGRVRRSHARSNWKQEDLDACDRQAVWSACLPDGSRVRRESHARFCERPVVKFHRPTQPFGPHCFAPNGRWYLGASPSKKSVARIKQKVGDLLVPNNVEVWSKVRDRLNQILRGWSAYFSYGNYVSSVLGGRLLRL